MPSNDSPADGTTRRRALGALGTALAGGLAGCAGRVPGAGPVEMDAETTAEPGELQWQYPPREGDRDGVGYASIDTDRRERAGSRPPVLGLRFNATVGDIAASEPYRGYETDWFRFSVRPPRSYEGRLNYEMRVQPPGQWEEFGAYYDIEAGTRTFTTELRSVDTEGTIIVPAVFDPGVEALPESLYCTFTVQASRSGPLGKTVRASDDGTLELDAE
ncbi:hypothetical protein [Halorarius halobius]|uniref:hypothetical protein n=1 Tax=Halorarius halobius TaxID=2962671 RepID=UPI0020CC585E|nr:hypothetical protein [Halorarius halobius]